MKTKVIQIGAQIALITWAVCNMTGEVHYYWGVTQIKMLHDNVAHDLMVKVSDFCRNHGVTLKAL